MSSSPETSRWRAAAGDAGVWLLVAALALLGVAALEPTLRVPRVLHRHLLVFDITQSMNVADTGTDGALTRLEQAKRAAVQALPALDCGSEVGIGLFTGHRSLVLFTPVEVCAHYGEITSVVRGIDWRMAWEFKSEVAKGLHSALDVALRLEEPATVVFLTDGHEAPPVNPQYPPRYRHEPGEARGVIVGVGGTTPVRIPKLAPDGRQRGWFGADEVAQVDPYTRGRPTGDGTEAMVGAEAPVQGFTRREHLSALRADYLQSLAGKLEIGFARLREDGDLESVLLDPALGRNVHGAADLRWLLGLLAMLAVLPLYLPRAWLRRPRRAAAAAGRAGPGAAGVPAAGRPPQRPPVAAAGR